VVTDILGGSGGATSFGDGVSAIDTHGGNCAILSAEMMESICPIRVASTALVEGSGGDGQAHGGKAIVRDYEFLSHGLTVNLYIQQIHDQTRPWGDSQV
jgi:N-methylhydantoinase B